MQAPKHIFQISQVPRAAHQVLSRSAPLMSCVADHLHRPPPIVSSNRDRGVESSHLAKQVVPAAPAYQRPTVACRTATAACAADLGCLLSPAGERTNLCCQDLESHNMTLSWT